MENAEWKGVVTTGRLAALEAGYRIDRNNRILNPGKFEGQGYWVPYFWSMVGMGGEDETMDMSDCGGWTTYIFRINGEEKKLCPQLEGVGAVLVWETDSGFVYGTRVKNLDPRTFPDDCIPDQD
jgi:hypothetical protein